MRNRTFFEGMLGALIALAGVEIFLLSGLTKGQLIVASILYFIVIYTVSNLLEPPKKTNKKESFKIRFKRYWNKKNQKEKKDELKTKKKRSKEKVIE